MNFFEPVKGPSAVRRDELGNFNKAYRTKPHRGADFGYDSGSQGKPVFAVNDSVVSRILYTGELGHCLIAKHVSTKTYWMYSHLQNITAKKGDQLVGGKQFAEIGPHKNGPHLHLAVSKDQLPHLAAFHKLLDPFKLIDANKPKPVKKPVAKKKVTK